MELSGCCCIWPFVHVLQWSGWLYCGEGYSTTLGRGLVEPQIG
jgi:hypothetical protein